MLIGWWDLSRTAHLMIPSLVVSKRIFNYVCRLPYVWASKRQPLIALSTIEAEYIALSRAIPEVNRCDEHVE
jgi:hypothetical protein